MVGKVVTQEMLDWCAVIVSIFPLFYNGLREGSLEVTSADAFLDAFGIQMLHQFYQTCLRDLLLHGCTFDGLDFGVGFLLLVLRQGVDVVEDVFFLGDSEHLTHLSEHVVLRQAFAPSVSVLIAISSSSVSVEVVLNILPLRWFSFLSLMGPEEIQYNRDESLTKSTINVKDNALQHQFTINFVMTHALCQRGKMSCRIRRVHPDCLSLQRLRGQFTDLIEARTAE